MKEHSTVLAEHWLDETLKESFPAKIESKAKPDLILLYRVNSWRLDVKQVGYVRRDDKKAYRKDGWSDDIENRDSALFETEQQAIDWLFEHEKREIKLAEKIIKSAKNRLKKLNERYNKIA